MSRRVVINAFTRTAAGGRNPRESLAASLAALTARLRETRYGCELHLSPMLSVDAVRALVEAGGEPDQRTLVLSGSMNGSIRPVDFATVARRLGVAVEERLAGGRVIVDDVALLQLLSILPVGRLHAVRVAGPIEARDAAAIRTAAAGGDSPLEAEVRASGALRVVDDHAVHLQARDRHTAAALIAENLRHYLAALCDRPADSFAPLRPEQVIPFLDAGGLTVRPIETEVYSTFIDVGVCTTAEPPTGPAQRSLIYDLPSASWHDD